MKVEAGDHQPYIFDGRPYHRVQSTSPRIPQHRYEQLIVKRGQLNHSWEKFPADKRYTIDSLDHQEIHRTIEQGVRFNRIPPEALQDSVEDALTRLGLIENGRINNAAVTLFGNDLFPHYPQCLIKLGRFRGVDKLSDFIDNQQIYGHAFKQLSEASNFLMRHLPIASFFQEGQFERIDKPALPVLAVREALINAICHRDYSDQGGYITVAVFDDRLEIWSHGILPSPLKVEDLWKKHLNIPVHFTALDGSEKLYLKYMIEAGRELIHHTHPHSLVNPSPFYNIYIQQFTEYAFWYLHHRVQGVREHLNTQNVEVHYQHGYPIGALPGGGVYFATEGVRWSPLSRQFF